MNGVGYVLALEAVECGVVSWKGARNGVRMKSGARKELQAAWRWDVAGAGSWELGAGAGAGPGLSGGWKCYNYIITTLLVT